MTAAETVIYKPQINFMEVGVIGLLEKTIVL
jgi:hypothetical protein